jgi:hypothetical protein
MANVYTGAEPFVYEQEGGGILKRVSWGALFAGLVVSLVIMLMLTLLGLGIGLAVINPATEENPFGGMGIGSALWLGLSALIALFLGGWTTAKLAGSVRGLNGVLHSIVMWGLVTITTFFLLSTVIGSLVGGVMSIVGKSASALASCVAAAAPEAGEAIQKELQQRGITVDKMLSEAKEMVGQSKGAGAGGGAAETGDEDLKQALQKMFAGGQTSVNSEDKNALVTALMKRTNMSRPEAEQRVDSWMQQYQQAAQGVQQTKQQALQTTEQAMDALSKAGIWMFILLLLEAAAAALGGWLGSSRERVIETRHP